MSSTVNFFNFSIANGLGIVNPIAVDLDNSSGVYPSEDEFVAPVLCATDEHNVADRKIFLENVGAFAALIGLLFAFFRHLFHCVLVHASESVQQHINKDEYLRENAVDLWHKQ